MGRYISQPLTIHCKDMDEVRRFLIGCRAVTDEELFGKEDYWQPPDQFEKLKAGDCEDFSFWTWRQLLALVWTLELYSADTVDMALDTRGSSFFETANAFSSNRRLALSGWFCLDSRR